MQTPFPLDDDCWSLRFDRWQPRDEGRREALCTLANGYMGVRGAVEEGSPHSYPALYLAGGYNRRLSRLDDTLFEHEDLVRLPDPFALRWAIDDGPWLQPDGLELLRYEQALDLRRGLLERDLHLRDEQGRETRLRTRRLVHMDQPHLCALQWRLTPLNWSGTIRLRALLDGAIVNAKGPPGFSGDHLEVTGGGDFQLANGGAGIELRVRTRQSCRLIALAASLSVDGRAGGFTGGDGRRVWREQTLAARAGQTTVVEKLVAIYNDKDPAISEPGDAARLAVCRAGDFDSLLRPHALAWHQLWRRCDMRLRGRDVSQRALRLNIFHLLQTLSPHTVDLDVGVPARGWHGESYRGHVFWDELFVFPYLNLHFPEITRALLMYRHRRLTAARARARRAGLAGALYPWRSASSGREETASYDHNPINHRWMVDDTRLQRHVNAAIAYNIWQYHQATNDREFLARYGAEMVLEIARMWAASVLWNEQAARYEIRGVVGPDEFHTRYPGASEPGLDNNAYTNVMAAWTLRCAEEVLDALPASDRQDLIERLGLSEKELQAWRHIRRRLRVPWLDQRLIAQFDGWEKLHELDWPDLRSRHRELSRIDYVLDAEGDDVNRYQVAKQADVLMLFYLFRAGDLRAQLEEMDYRLEPEAIGANVDYHTRHTTHGSTLSRVVHAWVHARLDRPSAWHWFEFALHTELGRSAASTAGGVHLGAMAGSIDLLQRGFLGIETRGGELRLNPRLPQGLEEIVMRLRYRGVWVHIAATGEQLELTLDSASPEPLDLRLHDRGERLLPGELARFRRCLVTQDDEERVQWRKA